MGPNAQRFQLQRAARCVGLNWEVMHMLVELKTSADHISECNGGDKQQFKAKKSP